MASINMKALINRFRCFFGEYSNEADVLSHLEQIAGETVTHVWHRRTLILAALSKYIGQTVSFSASQPILPVPIYIADRACRVTSATFMQYVSSTVTATDTMGWHILVLRRGKGTTFASGNGSATITGTYSVTSYIAGLSSTTSKFSTSSQSFSALTQNVANAPNRLHLNKGANKLQLFPGDVLTAQVKKGSGTATDSGAIFSGGVLKIRVAFGEATE